MMTGRVALTLPETIGKQLANALNANGDRADLEVHLTAIFDKS
jgi:hypothetical protein